MPQAVACPGRQPIQQLVDLTEPERVGVEQVEEDRIHQHAHDLRRRRIARDHRPIGLFRDRA
jgi:hypothetical protein